MQNTKFIYFSDRILLDSRAYCEGEEAHGLMTKFWNENSLVIAIKKVLEDHSISARFVLDITKDGYVYDAWRDCVYYLFLVFDDPEDMIRFRLAWI